MRNVPFNECTFVIYYNFATGIVNVQLFLAISVYYMYVQSLKNKPFLVLFGSISKILNWSINE